MESSKLKKIIVIGVVMIVLATVGGIYFNKWLGVKMQKIQLGLSESNFPYRDYTQEELNKMYPQIKNADIATRVAPEQTYANFRQALKENNLEMAIAQLSKDSKRYEENKQILTQVYNEGKFQEAFVSYPEKIEKSYMYESIAQYEYDRQENGKVFVNSINFIKNSDGDWKIDSM